jgi:hypothetical protein
MVLVQHPVRLFATDSPIMATVLGFFIPGSKAPAVQEVNAMHMTAEGGHSKNQARGEARTK